MLETSGWNKNEFNLLGSGIVKLELFMSDVNAHLELFF